MNDTGTVIERTEAASVAMEEALDTIRLLSAQLQTLSDLGSRLEQWSHEHGAQLVPRTGFADTYGDGMRVAKRDVGSMVAAAFAQNLRIAMESGK